MTDPFTDKVAAAGLSLARPLVMQAIRRLRKFKAIRKAVLREADRREFYIQKRQLKNALSTPAVRYALEHPSPEAIMEAVAELRGVRAVSVRGRTNPSAEVLWEMVAAAAYRVGPLEDAVAKLAEDVREVSPNEDATLFASNLNRLSLPHRRTGRNLPGAKRS